MKYFKKFLILGLFALCGVSFCGATQVLCEDFEFDNLVGDFGVIDVIGQDDCYKDWSIDNDNILYLISVNSIENTEDGEFTIGDGYIYANDSTDYIYGILTSYRSLTLDFYSETSKIYTLSWRKLTNTDFYNLFNSGYSAPTVCPSCPLSNGTVSSLLGSGVVVKSKTGIVGNPQTQANWNTMYNLSDFGVNEGTICFRVNTFETRKTSSVYLYFGFSNANAIPSNRFQYRQNTTGSWVCAYGNKPELRFALYQNSSDTYTGYIETEAFLLSDLFNYSISTPSCPSCPSCPDQYTSLDCQTEYNLIPIEDVTKNYCEINFDLIDPIDCPSSPSSGSGDVQRSALYVNNVQYNGAPNLYVNINDLLDYSMTYVSGSAVIDVDGYKADTGYMSDILTIQEYHPSSEDFTVAFVSFLTYALPYVIVALFVLFIWKLIKKIFKS